jgi:hypothetical protein
MGWQGAAPQNCAYSSRHNEIVIDAGPIPAQLALTCKSEIPRKSKGYSVACRIKRGRQKTSKEKDAQKRKKPAAGGGAAGFRKEPNSDWEEECRCSSRQTWEEERPVWTRSVAGGDASLRCAYVYRLLLRISIAYAALHLCKIHCPSFHNRARYRGHDYRRGCHQTFDALARSFGR